MVDLYARIVGNIIFFNIIRKLKKLKELLFYQVMMQKELQHQAPCVGCSLQSPHFVDHLDDQ